MFTRGTRRFYRVIEESKLCRVHRVVERFIFVEYNVYTIRLRGQLTLLPTRARFSRDCSVLAQQTSNNDRPKIVGVIERRSLYDGRVKKYNNRYNVDKKKQEISLTQLLRNYHLIQEAIVSHQDSSSRNLLSKAMEILWSQDASVAGRYRGLKMIKSFGKYVERSCRATPQEYISARPSAAIRTAAE